MKLSIDTRSETWRYLENHFSERIEALRLKNDSMGLDQASTIALRARIDELKSLLKLPEKDVPLDSEQVY